MKINRKNKLLLNKLWKNRNSKQRSFLIVVVLPTLLAAIYYSFIASGLYVVESRFAVKGNETQQLDLLSGIAGLPATGGSSTNSYVLQDYIGSLDIINTLSASINIKNIYNNPHADWLSSLGDHPTQDQFVNYWRKRVTISFDPTTTIMTLKVRAFTPQDSKILSDAIIHQSELLVNNLSERAREDTLSFAREEVERAESRVKSARLAMNHFRNKVQDLDPTQTASAKMMLIGELEAELSKAQAELNAQKSYINSDAPIITNLVNKTDALREQIKKEKSTISSDSKTQKALSGVFADYEPLVVERTFAEKAYTSALASLEAARVDADRKHNYLATFVEPRVPDEAIEPNRVRNVVMILFSTMLIWSILMLFIGIIKEHVGWV